MCRGTLSGAYYSEQQPSKISALTTFALDNLACCLVWEMSSMNMALLFTIIFMSKQPLRPECLHFNA